MIPTPEFSRTIPLDNIGTAASPHSIEANPDECTALAKRFELEAVKALSAEAEVNRDGTTVFVHGTIAATVIQSCVVTGDRVSNRVNAAFTLRFVPEGQEPDEEEVELSAEECETLFYTDRVIDLGEAAAQTMALELDPFPRSKHAEKRLREAGVISEEEAKPLGALSGLRDALAKKQSED